MKYIIIHGHNNFGLTLTDDLYRRCNKALSITADAIYCSGGIFFNSQNNIPVSVAMKKYLTGATSLPITTEEYSVTTIENVERLLPYFNSSDELVIISSWYHLPRLFIVWKTLGKHLSTSFIGSSARFSIKRLFLEILGIYSVLLYISGFTKRELDFRNKRTIQNTYEYLISYNQS